MFRALFTRKTRFVSALIRLRISGKSSSANVVVDLSRLYAVFTKVKLAIA